MDKPIREEEYKGYKIKIYLDEDPINPRTEWDNFGHMICFDERHDLGDKHEFTVEAIQELVKKKNVIFLPLYLLDHSGLCMRTGPFWEDPGRCDSGQVGYIYCTYEDICKSWGKRRVTSKLKRWAASLLQSEVDIYDRYLSGNVLGYVIDSPDEVGWSSCWGYYDGADYVIKECQSQIDWHIEYEEKQAKLTSLVMAL